jgi:hypothetical protein
VEHEGAIHKISNKKVQSSKSFHLEVDMIIIIKFKWNMRKANTSRKMTINGCLSRGAPKY